MARIFISHSSRDNEWAIRVSDWLKENGWDDIFLDLDPVRGIAAGERWEDALQKSAHRCEVVLALVSPQWLASSWCKAEADAARLMGKRVIVALIGANKAQIPPELTDEQWVDLADPDGFSRLKEWLRHLPAAKTDEPSAPAAPPPGSRVAQRTQASSVESAGLMQPGFLHTLSEEERAARAKALAAAHVRDAEEERIRAEWLRLDAFEVAERQHLEEEIRRTREGEEAKKREAAATMQDERDELGCARMVLPSIVESAAFVPDHLTVDTMLSMSAMRELVDADAPAAVVARAPAPSAPLPEPAPPPAGGGGGLARTPPAHAPSGPPSAPAPAPPTIGGGGFAGTPPAHAPSAQRSAPAPPPPAKGRGGFARTLPIALIAIVAAYLVSRSWGHGLLSKMLTYLNFKLNVFSFFGLSRTRRSNPAGHIDLVDCSVFSPPVARPGSTVLVQVFLHVPQHADRAQFLASMADQTTTLKGVQTLKSEIARGASVTISLSAAELDIDEPQQAVIWRGEPVFCQFLVSLPKGSAGESFHPVVRVSVDGGLVGRIVFCLKADAEALAPRSKPAGETARRYELAFISYASADRKEVLKRAQVLKAAGVGFFQDILSLDPGTRWEREIYKNIDKSDLVLLFWSRAAKASEWVIREAEYALERRGDGDIPDVVPVILENPPPLPPPSLATIHFNDRIHYLIDAS